MCGFAGFFDPSRDFGNETALIRLRAMTGVIRHRGPDANGLVVEKESSGAVWAGLGHQRLSILDLSAAGAQPMESKCGRYVIAFNGEIYNYQNLRLNLESNGVIDWRGSSDTEVLIEGIVRYGLKSFLDKIDGMFAFALIDRETKSLTLARDAFGEKPLVYGFWKGVLLFGSDLRSLRAWPGFAPDENPLSRSEFMQYGCISAPATIHSGIYKLPAAHIVKISFEAVLSETLPSPVPWWDMVGAAITSRQDLYEGNFLSAVSAVEDVFKAGVSRRLISDVPVGVLLSGGIDSSLTAAFAQHYSDTPIQSFTIGMAEQGYDESTYAEAVAKHLGTQHETLMLQPNDILEEVPCIAMCYDEPFADSSQLPTYLVSRMARNHVTVALSGDGGDELFAGYNRHFIGPKLWSRMERIPYRMRSALGSGLSSISPEFLTLLVRAAGRFRSDVLAVGPAGEKLHKLARLLTAYDREDFHDLLLQNGRANKVLSCKTLCQGLTARTDERLKNLDFASLAMLFDTGYYLQNDILTKVDRASMAVSLETRTPFLNRSLFELAWRLPHSFKSKEAEGKRVLRSLLYRYVPREIVERPKAGFSMPIGRWLRGPLRDWAETHLEKPSLQRSEVFNVEHVRRIWEEHLNGSSNQETQIWNILMYQSWHDGQRDLLESRLKTCL